jgi:ParB family chromosome partitioning protein
MATAKRRAGSSAKRKPRARKLKADAASIGLSASQCGEGAMPADVSALCSQILARSGCVLATYREPFGGHWVVMASLPIDTIEPTPFQRELSAPSGCKPSWPR